MKTCMKDAAWHGNLCKRSEVLCIGMGKKKYVEVTWWFGEKEE